MKPIKQRYRHQPGKGIYGDCHRAAIASILELPLDDVPHFGDGGPDADEFERRTQAWLRTRGIVGIQVPYSGDLGHMFRCIKALNPGVYYLLGGESRTGVNHTVVCLNDEIVHDPSLNESGIIGPCDDGYYWVTYFGTARVEASRALCAV
jgi:hypothetical protein